MTSVSDRGREPDFIDVIGFMNYWEDHYHGTIKMVVENARDGGTHAVLCCHANYFCGSDYHQRHFVTLYAPLQGEVLRNLPRYALDLFYEALEKADGGCAGCRAMHGLPRRK
jgi:hypothetical protein